MLPLRGGSLLVAACSGADGGATPQATTSTAAAPQPLEQPSRRCGDPATKATLVRFRAADGTSLDGVLVGTGPAGVVLAHEYPADLCGFWPFAEYLANRGLRAFAIDLRCFGRSACPEGDARGRVVDDLDAAAAELRHRGVTRVALVGASMGGAAVKRLAVPAMLVVATNDRYVSVAETRAMYRAASTDDKRLEVLSGSFDGLHGWELLTNPANGESTSVAAKAAAFLTTHTRG